MQTKGQAAVIRSAPFFIFQVCTVGEVSKCWPWFQLQMSGAGQVHVAYPCLNFDLVIHVFPKSVHPLIRWFPIATSALAGQVRTFQHHVARSERNLTGMVDLLGCCGWQLLQTKERNDICIQSLHNLWPAWYPGRSKHLHEWKLISLHRCPDNGLPIFPW